MKRYICLLRGINVGGNNRISMADLTALCRELGFSGVRSYIQSGNLVFDANLPLSLCRRKLEEALSERLNSDIGALAMEADALARIRRDLHFDAPRVFFTFAVPGADEDDGAEPTPDLEPLLPLRAEGDELAAGPGVIYFHCPGSYGQSKLSNAHIERKLGIRATTRNLKTVDALIAMAEM
jgi:uncharacterized protein (DUF1697 family)